MTRRWRSIPRIACLSVATHQQESEEEEEEAECRRYPSASQRSRRRGLLVKCRRLALDLTLMLSSTFNSSDPTQQTAPRVSIFTFFRWRRRAPPLEDQNTWLLHPIKDEVDREKAEKGEEEHLMCSSLRFSFTSQLCPNSEAIAATVLLVNLESGKEEDDEAPSSSPSPSSSSLRRKEHPFLVLTQCRRRECLERAISPVAEALVRFSIPDIRAATKGFSRGRVLGRGAFSCVFRGRMRRVAVAVKRLQGPEEECAKAFCREVTIAGALRNANVVPLVGYCIDKEGLFLVYKYVSGGSLDQHLYKEWNSKASGSKKGVGLSWSGRLKVALGTARAVEYLHFGTDKCIIHRDIKPSNILISSNNKPKLCDFGLATWTCDPSQPFLCKTVKGTFGYLAPEYFQHGKLSDKTDVYAFGVLLLELISGRKAVDTSRPRGDENLVIWARPFLQQGESALKDLIDPRLSPGSYSRSEASRVMLAAAACLDLDDSSRPTIRETIKIICNNESVVNCCSNLSAYGQPWEEFSTGSDLKSHRALALYGVSDSEEDGGYGN